MDASLLPPVPDIVRSAYATLIVTSLDEARRFWVDLLGFAVTDEDADSLYLRGYDELTHHNLILRSGPVAAAGALGFRVRSDADLAKAEAYYAALGCRSERRPAGYVRGLGEVVRVEDPLGFLVDFFASADHPVLRWSVRDPRRRDFWGNAVIPSWYSDASVVLDLDGRVRPVVELAQAAEVSVGADGFTAPPAG